MKAQIQLPLVVILSTFIFTGCAVLQQPPAVAVHPARLACPDAPQIVDGNLQTVSALATDGYIEKRILVDYRRGKTLVNDRQIVGTKRAGALIVLKEPMYITHIEVYTDSAITEPLIDVATDKSLSSPLKFIPIKDPQIGKPIKPGQMRRFRVGQKIRYLRIMTDAVKDMSGIKRSTIVKTQVTRIPLKGPTIREIKLYEIPTESRSR
ncbi:hypothetical protein IH992_13370 [Candidatus Poribacteria bacterium]|nr:hypothetical protein [Candidatus Poribacteria bacterium]